MNEELKFQITENMEKYGGSFIKALAGCIRYADSVNLKKLEETFPAYIKQYENFGKK